MPAPAIPIVASAVGGGISAAANALSQPDAPPPNKVSQPDVPVTPLQAAARQSGPMFAGNPMAAINTQPRQSLAADMLRRSGGYG